MVLSWIILLNHITSHNIEFKIDTDPAYQFTVVGSMV